MSLASGAVRVEQFAQASDVQPTRAHRGASAARARAVLEQLRLATCATSFVVAQRT